MSARIPADVAKWDRMPMVGFDLETTSTDPHTAGIVTATIVVSKPPEPPEATTWIVDPGIPVPDEAAAIHGWTTERLRAYDAARDPGEASFEISAILARWMGSRLPVVAFNAPYDLTLLEAENARHGNPTLAERVAPKPVGPIIDPMVLDRHVDQYRKTRPAPTDDQPDRRVCACGCGAEAKNLAGCCRHYGVELRDAHTSEADATAAVHLARAIIRRYPSAFRGFTVGTLHMAQVDWKREQADNLRAFFDRVGKDHDGVPGEWPLLLPAPVAAESGGW